jgi:hypothetical protein
LELPSQTRLTLLHFGILLLFSFGHSPHGKVYVMDFFYFVQPFVTFICRALQRKDHKLLAQSEPMPFYEEKYYLVSYDLWALTQLQFVHEPIEGFLLEFTQWRFIFSDLSMQAPNISYLFDLIISGYLLVVYIQRLVYSFQFNAILQDGSLKMTLIPWSLSRYLLVVYIQRLVYSFQFNAILQDGALKNNTHTLKFIECICINRID